MSEHFLFLLLSCSDCFDGCFIFIRASAADVTRKRRQWRQASSLYAYCTSYNYMITCGACIAEHSFESCSALANVRDITNRSTGTVSFLRTHTEYVLYTHKSNVAIVEVLLSAIFLQSLSRTACPPSRAREWPMNACSTDDLFNFQQIYSQFCLL